MLLANEDAAGVQNFDQHRNATGSMLLSSVGDGRLEIGLTFASALFSGPSLSKKWSLSPFCMLARDWGFKFIKFSAIIAKPAEQHPRKFLRDGLCVRASSHF